MWRIWPVSADEERIKRLPQGQERGKTKSADSHWPEICFRSHLEKSFSFLNETRKNEGSDVKKQPRSYVKLLAQP